MSEVKQEAQDRLAESTQTIPQSTAAQQSDNVAHALAGAGGGLLSMALTYPLITLSTRAQVESKRAQSSTLGAARRIIKREGVTGLYAGMDSALFGITVTNFVYYYCTSLCPNHNSAPLIRQGTNGPAPSSKKPPSRPVAPLASSPLLSP
jgi:adenine nucleotide transporter 17